jgi:hypothetical protein
MVHAEKRDKMTYATLTNEQKAHIRKEWEWLNNKSDPCHIAACIAEGMTEGRNQRIKSNAFAAVLTFLVWQEKVSVTWQS